MKKKYSYSIGVLSLCLIFILISSCKKFVEVGTPKNQLTSTAVFADSTSANSAILGIYINMMQAFSLGFSSGGITLYPGLSSDELYTSTTDANTAEFFVNNISSTNTLNRALWVSAYQYIYSANACIEGVAASGNISTTAKNSLTGEAKFIRAFLYFNLVNLYGPVPVITTTDYDINRVTGRSSTDLVYSQIIADLQYAQANLPNSSSVSERANFFSATALLAKVYLYRGSYASAQTEATKIINSGNYMLMTDPSTVFLATSKETIWRFIPVYSGKETWEGYYFVPSSTTAKPKYILTSNLFNSFESGDIRKREWVNINTVSGLLYPYPYKYKNTSTTSTPTESYVVFRLAEQYLIRAEAEANLNDITDAALDLNVIRKRAGLSNTTASNKPSMLSAIEKERQAELFCEWGNRFFDLKRTNRADAILSPQKVNWRTGAGLYPIPQTELNADPNLTQNSGY